MTPDRPWSDNVSPPTEQARRACVRYPPRFVRRRRRQLEDYLCSLRADPPDPASCHVFQVTGFEQEAAILYEHGRSPTPRQVAQFNRLARGLISEARLGFDASSLPRR